MIETITWVSCDKRLPDPGDEVLVAMPGAAVDIAVFWETPEDGPVCCDRDTDEVLDYQPTHWAALPVGPGE